MAEHDYSQDYFTIEALIGGEINIYEKGSNRTTIIYYSTNGGNWEYAEITTANTLTIQVQSGDIVEFKSFSWNLVGLTGSYQNISCTSCKVYGNIMSLVYVDDFKDKTSNGYFNGLFSGNTGITDASNLILPATTLRTNCYYQMFRGCTSLITAPELPATTLSQTCYYQMFFGCTSLTTAPELPATTLSNNCYGQMFYGCTNLTTAPTILPALSLRGSCYNEMFAGCTSLTKAPDLPATTLVANYCYAGMFYGCTSLNYIKCFATDISGYNCTTSWVYNVASAGTFVKSASMSSLAVGVNGIPSGWNVVNDSSTEFLMFVIKGSGDIKWSGGESIEYSTDYGNNWNTITNVGTIDVVSGQTVLFKGIKTYSHVDTFSGSTAEFNVEGNIMSLVYGDDFNGKTSLGGSASTFENLFLDCNVVSAENLILPATALTQYCYKNMFNGCSSLTSVPVLSATELANGCYNGMFNGCISLTTTPELSAMNLEPYCYSMMFAGCTSLTMAPILSPSTLVPYCYYGMFSGCSSLNYIKCLATSISANNCTGNWVCGVAPTGTFVKSASMGSWTVGVNGIPIGWVIIDPSADYYGKYFTIEALSGGVLSLEANDPTLADSQVAVVGYRVNGGNWISATATTANSITIQVQSGDIVEWKSSSWTNKVLAAELSMRFVGTSYKAYGNIMSLAYGDIFESKTDLSLDMISFIGIFNGSTGITDAENLILPATTLYNKCYSHMFSGCTNLTNTPALPAITMADYCYANMFSTCTSLTTAPVLPATTLSNNCYSQMFYGCTNLTTAPELPATTLAPYCYLQMFGGCTSLTTAPELPATTLVANYCYAGMFTFCTSLTKAPDLPATTLANGCYHGMFTNCTSLTIAPSLPATTLTNSCYFSMFDGCRSLISAPVLPATTLVENCYRQMFLDCSNLRYIKCLATNISASNCTNNWVRGVYPTGTFVKSASMNSWTIGVNGIPVGWIIKNDGDIPIDCLSFKVESGNSGEIRWVSTTSSFTSTISYSKDNGTTWTSITSSTGNTAPSIPVNGGDIVLFKGNNLTYSLDSLYYLDHAYFKSNFYYSIEGNILSLVYGDTYSGQTELPQESGFTFSGLFIDNTGLTSASGLSLPATTLSKGCYSFMFQGCTNLASIPELPATELAESCYYGMFNYCSSITTPPTLPATTLAKRCYAYMFGNCSSLATAPALPVTALTESCYDCMFFKCVSLTTAPELPAEKMVHRCYYYMFAYCSSLNYIKCLANSGFEEEYTTVGWVNTVSSSGTFIKNQSASGWIVGDNGIPEYWTVQVA